MADEQAQTGTRDETYDLVSALYHLLQGAETCAQYLRDAETSGDDALVQFFRDWQEEQRNLSERAKNLLAQRLGGAAAAGRAPASAPRRKAAGAKEQLVVSGRRRPVEERENAHSTSFVGGGGRSGGNATDDAVDEGSKESFPASDAPQKY